MSQDVVVTVGDPTEPGAARRTAVALATAAGFDEIEAGRVAIVVTEAAANLVRHGGGGQILLRASNDAGSPVLTVLALDRGPGIGDLAEALRDGFSTAGGAGTGLGAIRRLSGLFDVFSAGSGTAVLSRLWREAPLPEGAVEMGAVCVAHPDEEVCGDDWAAVHGPRRTLVMVVDGVGHGVEAAEAARTATAVFRKSAAETPAEILARVHEALRGSRGAAASVAAVDGERREVVFAGIGNVAGAVVGGGTARSMATHYGTLGHQVRRIQEFRHPWPEWSLVVLHSDGLGSRWALDRYPGLAERHHPMLAAGVLYRDFRRERDDASVVVLRERR